MVLAKEEKPLLMQPTALYPEAPPFTPRRAGRAGSPVSVRHRMYVHALAGAAWCACGESGRRLDYRKASVLAPNQRTRTERKVAAQGWPRQARMIEPWAEETALV